MDSVELTYCSKRERLLDCIEFKPFDRLPVQGWNGTLAAIERITSRRDYVDNPKEIFAETMRKCDIDLILQFVLPDRRDRQCGPGAEVDTWHGLHSVTYGMLDDWIKEKGQVNSPEDFRDFCMTVPPAQQAENYVD